MKYLYDVSKFIKLFSLNGKLAKTNHWDEIIINMFTKGYCYNFAKALQISFHQKYDCTIVGIATMSIIDYQMCDRTILKEALSQLEFEHYVCQIEHKQDPTCVYNCDILGVWPLDEPSDYRVIHIKTPEAKQMLLDMIDKPEQFLKNYSNEGCYGWRFMWYFSNSEQSKLERWFNITKH